MNKKLIKLQSNIEILLTSNINTLSLSLMKLLDNVTWLSIIL